MTFAPGEIPVARGATIGRSGNAGSSGGPHLHMDVRHTATGDPVDPMPYFKTSFADKTAPEMRKLTLYAVDAKATWTMPQKTKPPHTASRRGEKYIRG